MVAQKALSKIVIRRLPPDMTEVELKEILAPLPPHDYFKFHEADMSLAPVHTTRVYINFPNFDDVLLFRDKFDGQIFEDKRGHEYPAYVEVSPFQLIPKEKHREDKHNNTIQEDDEFIKFKEEYEGDDNEVTQINIEEYLKEAAAKDEARKQTQSTPLIDFIRNKRETKKKQRDDRRRDDRKKRRDDERKAKRKTDHKERIDRKKELIDSKNPRKERQDGEDGSTSVTPELNPNDPRNEPKKGGRFAAREKRKKEFEERRKQKHTTERAAKKSDRGNPDRNQDRNTDRNSERNQDRNTDRNSERNPERNPDRGNAAEHYHSATTDQPGPKDISKPKRYSRRKETRPAD